MVLRPLRRRGARRIGLQEQGSCQSRFRIGMRMRTNEGLSARTKDVRADNGAAHARSRSTRV